MTLRLLLILIAFSLSACAKIEVGDAGLENPKDLNRSGGTGRSGTPLEHDLRDDAHRHETWPQASVGYQSRALHR